MEYSETLAEIIRIILGDGSLRYDEENHKYNLKIYLNGVDDHEYFQYIKKIFDNSFKLTFMNIGIKIQRELMEMKKEFL